MVGSGKARSGVVRRSRHVKPRRGQARFGEAWSGLAVEFRLGMLRFVAAWSGGQGYAGCGLARCGKAVKVGGV